MGQLDKCGKGLIEVRQTDGVRESVHRVMRDDYQRKVLMGSGVCNSRREHCSKREDMCALNDETRGSVYHVIDER